MKNINKISLIKTIWIFIPLLIWYAFGWLIFPYFLKNATLPDDIEGKFVFSMMPYIISGLIFVITVLLVIYYIFLNLERER